MRRKKKDAAFLFDMLDAAKLLLGYVRGKTRDEFDADRMLRDAVERRIEIIGEAARNVSQEFRDANAAIPWLPIMRTRHILAHDYDVINYDVIWRVATVHVPELILLLEPLIPPVPTEADPQQPLPAPPSVVEVDPATQADSGSAEGGS